MWPIYNIALENKTRLAQVLLIVSVQCWALRDVSWYARFTKKQRAYVDIQNWQIPSLLDNLGEPVRPVWVTLSKCQLDYTIA